MPEFDPMRMYSYTASEIADFIDAGQITKEELYANGYPASKRPELETELNSRAAAAAAKARLPIEDDEMWQWARRQHTISAYQKYLSKYDTFGEDEYKGKYVFDARAAIDDLKAEQVKLREDLFKAMKNEPWRFKSEVVRFLIEGVDAATMDAIRHERDIASRFIANGGTIRLDEIVEAGLIPRNWNVEKTILAPDAYLPQTNIDELGEFPVSGRTDVFFLGVPRGGKSSVMAGLFHEMFRLGQVTYEPQYNSRGADPGNAYFNGLIQTIGNHKFPTSTEKDSISFMKIKLTIDRRSNPLTFVEIAGEAFREMSEGISSGQEVWERLGASQCLRSRNRKFLAFVVDYSLCVSDQNVDWDDTRQSIVLSNALTVLSHDGTGRDGTEGCTMSKVDTVAVIVTKSDLMGNNLPRDQREARAAQYLGEKFANFMNNLYMVSQEYGINAPIGNRPYILTFSLGKLCIGNTFEYDPTDSANLINFISSCTQAENHGFLGRLFGRR